MEIREKGNCHLKVASSYRKGVVPSGRYFVSDVIQSWSYFVNAWLKSGATADSCPVRRHARHSRDSKTPPQGGRGRHSNSGRNRRNEAIYLSKFTEILTHVVNDG